MQHNDKQPYKGPEDQASVPFGQTSTTSPLVPPPGSTAYHGGGPSDFFTSPEVDFDTAYEMMTSDQLLTSFFPDPARSPNEPKPSTPSPQAVGSPVSPNTRLLLNTFNNLNYSLSSRSAMNEWAAKDGQPGQPVPQNQVPIQQIQQTQQTQHPLGLPPAPSLQPQTSRQSHAPSMQSAQSALGGQVNLNSSTELLSMTESSALENFLDSIANDASIEKLAKQWTSIDPGFRPTLKRKQDPTDVPLAKYRKVKRESGVIRTVGMARSLLTDEEKKQNHTMSEQKRRALIKDSFKSLAVLLDGSSFRATREDKNKSKSRRKAMSKFNVLNRAVVEIELLKQLNDRLRDLVES